MKMKGQSPIKFIFFILAGIALVFVVSSWIDYRLSKKNLLQITKQYALLNLKNYDTDLESEIDRMNRLSKHAAILLSKTSMDSILLEQVHLALLQLIPATQGISIRYNCADDKGQVLYDKYFCKINSDSAHAQPRPYFAEILPESRWISGSLFSDKTSANSLYIMKTGIRSSGLNQNEYITIDFNLSFVKKSLNKNSLPDKCKYYIINDTGEVLIHHNENFLSQKNLAEFIVQDNKSAYLKIWEGIQSGKETFILPEDYNHKEAAYITPVSGINWFFIATIPGRELSGTLLRQFFYTTLTIIITLLIASLVISYYRKSLTAFVGSLLLAMKGPENGNTINSMPEFYAGKEIGDVSETLTGVQNKMRHLARGYKNSLAEKRALKHDLRVANKIQLSMLPKQNRSLTDDDRVDIFTRMIPAKDVAGDFYDYFFIADDLLFFVVGDVSGKGIPAALNMVKTLTLLRSESKKSDSPSVIFSRTSDVISVDNDEGVFVTAIGGTLNINTGEMILCDAGHNPPFMSFGSKEFNKGLLRKNLPLGVLSGKHYTETRYQLETNDTLLLYTDGLSEGMNKRGEMFEESRILHAIKMKSSRSLQIIYNNLQAEFIDFTGDSVRSDDITLMIIRYTGSIC